MARCTFLFFLPAEVKSPGFLMDARNTVILVEAENILRTCCRKNSE